MANFFIDPVGLMGSVLRFCTSTEVPWLTIPSTGSWTLWALATSAFDDLDVDIYIYLMCIYIYIMCLLYVYVYIYYICVYIYMYNIFIYICVFIFIYA